MKTWFVTFRYNGVVVFAAVINGLSQADAIKKLACAGRVPVSSDGDVTYTTEEARSDIEVSIDRSKW